MSIFIRHAAKVEPQGARKFVMAGFNRREFIQASSGLAMGAALPMAFRRAAMAAEKSNRETVLVVIELTGGNDGLNTVVPYRDPIYKSARPNLKLSNRAVSKIDNQLAFHPSLKGFSELLEDSQLAIVQGVGYPNPNRSHFESMDIWHKATREKSERFGWLGRTTSLANAELSAMSVGDGESPLALFSPAGPATSVRSLDSYRLKTSKDRQAVMEKFANRKPASSNPLLSLVQNSTASAYQTARRLENIAKGAKSAEYPQTSLGRRLQLVGQLISAELPERVYYVSHGGFDTHASQLDIHGRLLQELGDAVRAFQNDLKDQGQADRVVTMTFSEFGRRVKENGSGGTDHGLASQMFFVGPKVKSGLVGEHPRLDDLTDGDLKHHTDFRSVYATVLDQWLGVDAKAVLGGTFETVPVFGDVQSRA
ncbi:DUF1501 domain-containing protein [Thalassoroseus pseudoceratinae]|uniref:DUF1501 domain-containing protein n=1 Tax=Thalassoroseus pseudoceratinae TaxID=2713176 RepID=UPI001420F995|nr:DUF1501 domain-containing protein [Thalassoroseus pseudoceratinae]